ncbi:MAG: DUF2141 domain-containing protein [Cyclobacteriaceae bacterium]
MRHYLLLLFSFLPSLLLAQLQDGSSISYLSRNATGNYLLLMENEDLPFPGAKDSTYSITITITDIRSKDGVIRFKFYDEMTPFPDAKGFLRIVIPKSDMVDNKLTVTYHGFPSKPMGIALLDDENNNWELDRGWLLPKEGHAFADYYHTELRRPVSSDFFFTLTGNRHVIMKMRYY